MKINCTHCTKEFDRYPSAIRQDKNFCSRSCANTYHNLNAPPKRQFGPRPQNRRCCSCRILKSSKLGRFIKHEQGKQKFLCFECKPKRKLLTLDTTVQEAIRGQKHANKYTIIRWHARQQTNAKTCESCGYNKHVEVCHIRSIKDFPPMATLGEVNAQNNLKVLCPNCHWEFDHPSD